MRTALFVIVFFLGLLMVKLEIMPQVLSGVLCGFAGGFLLIGYLKKRE